MDKEIKIVWHWHNPPATLTNKKKNYFKKIFRDRFYIIINNWIDRQIAISSEIYLWLLSICKNVSYIPNGISLRKFDNTSIKESINVKNEFGIPQDAKIICSVANFRAQKDFHTLLLAAKEVILKEEKSYFILVGDGPIKEEIVKLSFELGIEKNIIFTGIRSDTERIIDCSSIFVLSTNYEGFGYVLCEAMALGKPVIATNVGGCQDIIKKESGILTIPHDAINLAESILKLLNNPAMALKMGSEGKKIVKSKFCLEKQSAEIVNLYKQLI